MSFNASANCVSVVDGDSLVSCIVVVDDGPRIDDVIKEVLDDDDDDDDGFDDDGFDDNDLIIDRVILLLNISIFTI